MNSEGLPSAKLVKPGLLSLVVTGTALTPALVAFNPDAGLLFSAFVAVAAFGISIYSPTIKYFLPDDVEFLEEDDE